jgi:hypothetical protein
LEPLASLTAPPPPLIQVLDYRFRCSNTIAFSPDGAQACARPDCDPATAPRWRPRPRGRLQSGGRGPPPSAHAHEASCAGLLLRHSDARDPALRLLARPGQVRRPGAVGGATVIGASCVGFEGDVCGGLVRGWGKHPFDDRQSQIAERKTVGEQGPGDHVGAGAGSGCVPISRVRACPADACGAWARRAAVPRAPPPHAPARRGSRLAPPLLPPVLTGHVSSLLPY